MAYMISSGKARCREGERERERERGAERTKLFHEGNGTERIGFFPLVHQVHHYPFDSTARPARKGQTGGREVNVPSLRREGDEGREEAVEEDGRLEEEEIKVRLRLRRRRSRLSSSRGRRRASGRRSRLSRGRSRRRARGRRSRLSSTPSRSRGRSRRRRQQGGRSIRVSRHQVRIGIRIDRGWTGCLGYVIRSWHLGGRG